MNPIRHFFKRLRTTDRRRYARTELPPLKLKIDGKRYSTIDWSLGGFRIGRYHASLQSGDKVSGHITLEHAAPGEFVAEVVALRGGGEVAFRLLEITPSTFLAMSGIKEA